jgi:hypothetical protein
LQSAYFELSVLIQNYLLKNTKPIPNSVVFRRVNMYTELQEAISKGPGAIVTKKFFALTNGAK